MGQVLHANARTTEETRRDIQKNSKEHLIKLSSKYGVNPKTISEILSTMLRWVLKRLNLLYYLKQKLGQLKVSCICTLLLIEHQSLPMQSFV